jgi:transcriptional regulator with XRE-family HTH domain
MALRNRAMGRRIAELRETRRLSQPAAADKVGVSLRAYQKWEAGGGIRYPNLERLADTFGARVEDITGQDSTPDPFRTSSQLDRLEDLAGSVYEQLEQVLANQETILQNQKTIIRRLPVPSANGAAKTAPRRRQTPKMPRQSASQKPPREATG